MDFIAIETPKNVPFDMVLTQVAMDILEGYGAGTIMFDEYPDEIGFWTSRSHHMSGEYDQHIHIDNPTGDSHVMACYLLNMRNKK